MKPVVAQPPANPDMKRLLDEVIVPALVKRILAEQQKPVSGDAA